MILGTYTNGNYRVKIYSDGTKIRITDDDHFSPSFAESMDMKVTDCCDGKCSFCYANAYPGGKSMDMSDPDIISFLNTIHPYTEVAINLNDMGWPYLSTFLKRMGNQKVIVNGTINIRHLTPKNSALLEYWQEHDMLKGIGVSILSRQDLEVIPEILRRLDNVVFHVVCGLIDKEFIDILSEDSRFHDVKALFLGYKALDGKGFRYFEENNRSILDNTEYLRLKLPVLMNNMNVVSFDNLAIEQLGIRDIVKDADWNQHYMGDEGEFTFYVDMVNKQFAPSSTDSLTNFFPIASRSASECFKEVRRISKHEEKERTEKKSSEEGDV